MLDPIEQFRAAIMAAGIEPPKNIVADGKLRRFSTNGNRNVTRAGMSYISTAFQQVHSATGALTSMKHGAPRRKPP
jgi:hypothetical protein